jgi:CHRD domain-containing protein
MDPDLTNGWVQGFQYLASYVDNGPLDLNTNAGRFEFDISRLDIAPGTLVTITANYSKDAPKTHNGTILTSPFSAPVALPLGPLPASPGEQVYDDPVGGWTYVLDGTQVIAGPGGTNFTSLDGTWSHDNGSDTWDGSAVGGTFAAGTNAPGGVSSIDGYLRIQDPGDPRNAGFADPGNRKIYFGHNISAEGAATNVLDSGVTLHFRARIPTAGLLDDRFITAQTNYPASGDGYQIHDGGKGNFGVKQASGGIVSFSLATAADNTSGPGLLMNSRNGTTANANVDSGDGGTTNILSLDPTLWHEFWITIRADTTGGGTHRVDIYLDGSLSSRTFYVTAGDGSDFTGISYIAMGCGSTGQSGAFDVDYFTYKLGAVAPTGSAIPVFTSASIVGNNIVGTWVGGRPPYTVQGKVDVGATNSWTDLATGTNLTAAAPATGFSTFYRIANRVMFNVSLSGANERPSPVTNTTATGGGTLILDGNKLTGDITYTNLSAPLSAVHFHGPGTTEESVGVIIPLAPLQAGQTAGTVRVSVTLTNDQPKWFLNGLVYFNIHTANNPGGEIRGQLPAVQKLNFVARLNGANERPNPITTAGQGAATLVLDNNQLKYDLNYYGLSGAPSAAHLHGPGTTEQAVGVLYPITGVGTLGTAGHYSGALTLKAAEVLYLLNGLTYLNIHTTANSGGEIRGQVTP